jgi:uridine kinase
MSTVSGGNRIDEHAPQSPATPRPGERCEFGRQAGKHCFPERTIVIAIGGGSASGKTTLARVLAESMGAALVAHDRYYHSASAATNFDHPEALDTDKLVEDLCALRRGEAVRLPVYDFSRHVRLPEEHWELVQPCRTVVVEGILVLAVEHLRAHFDTTVFVDTPDDLRLLRRVRRDLSERGRTAEQVFDQYLATVRPMHERFVVPSRQHAHHVVDGTAPLHETVPRLLALLGHR